MVAIHKNWSAPLYRFHFHFYPPLYQLSVLWTWLNFQQYIKRLFQFFKITLFTKCIVGLVGSGSGPRNWLQRLRSRLKSKSAGLFSPGCRQPWAAWLPGWQSCKESGQQPADLPEWCEIVWGIVAYWHPGLKQSFIHYVLFRSKKLFHFQYFHIFSVFHPAKKDFRKFGMLMEILPQLKTQERLNSLGTWRYIVNPNHPSFSPKFHSQSKFRFQNN